MKVYADLAIFSPFTLTRHIVMVKSYILDIMYSTKIMHLNYNYISYIKIQNLQKDSTTIGSRDLRDNSCN